MKTSMRHKTSKIWAYYTLLDSSVARCILCKNKYSYKSSISNLKKHISIKHPNIESIKSYCKNKSRRIVKLDSKTEPLERERNSSPAASEAESNNAAPDTSAFDANPLSTYRPDESNDVTQPLKKIKITHQQQSQFEEPFTEGYLEDYQSKIPKVSRRRSPPPPSPQAAQLRQKPRAPHRQDNAKHICTSCPCIAAQESEYDKIGKAWASELKMMSFDQQIYAKRAIAEILFEGQLGSLSRDSVKVLHEDPFVVEESEYVYDKSDSNAAAVA